MFCSQCEQTQGGEACIKTGACGKNPEVDALQDLMLHTLRGLAEVAIAAEALPIPTLPAGRLTCETLFATLTNVNFDPADFTTYIRRVVQLREALKAQIAAVSAQPPTWSALAEFLPAGDRAGLVQQGQEQEYAFISQGAQDVDSFSLKLTVVYGLKGIAAYAFHAQELGQEDAAVYRFCHQALAALANPTLTLNEWVNLALRLGEVNLRVMELLDQANTETYGHPTPTAVPIQPRAGKAILVSGHDLLMLERLLQQTQDTGITVYTHGELLPAHGYPRLKQRYPHLYGHYGTGWQNQTREFAQFPGPVVMTTNCLMPPKDAYRDQVFTLGPVGWPGLTHLSGTDFQLVIDRALAMPGFQAGQGGAMAAGETPRQVTTGFARNAVLSVADQVIAAVKRGDIRHFFLVGGCDGARPGRSYYSDFVAQVPDDCVVLTLACGKFRFFDQNLGAIGDIPRLLDVGQCNDAYSAIQIALALANAFEVDVNDLPLSMILSWYEQKAVAILLTLLHLGIRNIRLGPTLPAFLSPNVLALLSQQYNLQPTTTPEADLAACLS